MSARALRLAVVDHLRSELIQPSEGACEITIDGAPPPICGQRFLGVHAGDWSNAANESLDERVSVQVTITDRMGVFPLDRQDTDALEKAKTGLETFAEAVVNAVHSNYDVLNAANALVEGAVTKFVEPLRFRHGERPTYRDGTWFSADPDQGAGLSITLTFGDARRVQKIDDLDYEMFQPGLILREDGTFMLREDQSPVLRES